VSLHKSKDGFVRAGNTTEYQLLKLRREYDRTISILTERLNNLQAQVDKWELNHDKN